MNSFQLRSTIMRKKRGRIYFTVLMHNINKSVPFLPSDKKGALTPMYLNYGCFDI